MTGREKCQKEDSGTEPENLGNISSLQISLRFYPGGRVGTSGSGEVAGKSDRRVNTSAKKCVHMHVNAKM
jgi:hypothetical protein